ncbi:MAG: SDR family oxidoreductase [Bacteroidota bacterium]
MTSTAPHFDLRGRVALVTGASSGIGRATAIELARCGAQVVINYPFFSEAPAARETLRLVEEAARSSAARHRHMAGDGSSVPVPVLAGHLTMGDGLDAKDTPPVGLLVRADVSDEDDVRQMFEEIAAVYGPLDILVNNAGIQIEAPSHEVTMDDFDKVLGVNLRGAFMVAQGAIRQFRAAGKPGTIVNLSSVHEKIPRPSYLSYSISKFGIKGMTQTLALEYANDGIRVNAVAPGATETPIQSWLHDSAQTAVVASHIPQKRIAQPEEIAHAIAYLASDVSRYVTGQTLFIDGGLTLFADFQEPWSG